MSFPLFLFCLPVCSGNCHLLGLHCGSAVTFDDPHANRSVISLVPLEISVVQLFQPVKIIRGEHTDGPSLKQKMAWNPAVCPG